MEFIGLKCPVCDIDFKDGDDIVVCPECGAPHHRECWEAENRCAYHDKHAEGFEYNAQDNNNKADVTICPNCKAENAKDAFYCSKCGTPLNMTYSQTYNQPEQNYSANPFATAFDPMAGINPDEDMGGVTAGELAKYVGNNTPYFLRAFSSIKNFGKSRFNFIAFLFSGFYLLYRKMYKLGIIFAAAVILLLTVETYIQYSPAYTALAKAVQSAAVGASTGYFSNYSTIIKAFLKLDMGNQMLIGIMGLCSSLRLGIQIITGVFANRWYFRHCRTQIKKIKDTEENPNKAIESKGGVNLALAISIGVIYLAVNIIPMFIFGY